jgi:hypothetical protein
MDEAVRRLKEPRYSASRPDLCFRWLSRLVATAAEDCLNFRQRVLRFALWLVAYVTLGLLLAIFVQSLVNWLLG